jgi:SAM-dependent methyltransferase
MTPDNTTSAAAGDPPDWVTFWDQQSSIYVNARHFDMHYRDIAEGIVGLLPGPDLRVLDFGCGEAIHADKVAAACARLWLCEAAASVRTNLARRFAANPKIAIADPDEIARLPDGALDVIVANSVLQYVPPNDADTLLAQWRRLLSPGGTLIVGDIIPPNVGPVSDLVALLRYALKNGFLLAALAGLARTLVSPYRKIRARLGVTMYPEPVIVAKLRAAGFVPRRLPYNLEHNPARMTFVCARA